MSIESTCTLSCLVTASHISPGPGRRSALCLMIGLARMWSGWPTFLLDLATSRMELAAISAQPPALPDGRVRQLERPVHNAVFREAARRRIQERREAARHGEVLSPLQEAR